MGKCRERASVCFSLGFPKTLSSLCFPISSPSRLSCRDSRNGREEITLPPFPARLGKRQCEGRGLTSLLVLARDSQRNGSKLQVRENLASIGQRGAHLLPSPPMGVRSALFSSASLRSRPSSSPARKIFGAIVGGGVSSRGRGIKKITIIKRQRGQSGS